MEVTPQRDDPQRCRACGSSGSRAFYETMGIPVQSCVLLDTSEEALAYPTGDLRLHICESCGFIWNALYSEDVQGEIEDYESSQANSAHFSAFLRDQCDTLVSRHGITNQQVIEIGCGGGDFLRLLCELGENCGFGFDPTYCGALGTAGEKGQASFVKDFYGERYFDIPASLIACRHTLEHIAEPLEFVRMLRGSGPVQSGALVFFEVPDALRVLRERAFWDVYYEHCSYFSRLSLEHLFARCGFAIEELELVYDGQYLIIAARSVEPGSSSEVPAEELQTILAASEEFSEQVARQLGVWRERLDTCAGRGEKVVLWGAGSKAAGFLSALGGRPEVREIVDINPRKQGMYQAGSGQRIVGPGELAESPPDLVIIMNPVYRDEIARDLSEMGLHPQILAL